jgi:hypothetical protein
MKSCTQKCSNAKLEKTYSLTGCCTRCILWVPLHLTCQALPCQALCIVERNRLQNNRIPRRGNDNGLLVKLCSACQISLWWRASREWGTGAQEREDIKRVRNCAVSLCCTSPLPRFILSVQKMGTALSNTLGNALWSWTTGGTKVGNFRQFSCLCNLACI